MSQKEHDLTLRYGLLLADMAEALIDRLKNGQTISAEDHKFLRSCINTQPKKEKQK